MSEEQQGGQCDWEGGCESKWGVMGGEGAD